MFPKIITEINSIFNDFNVRILDQARDFLIVEVNFSSIFRKLDSPVRILISTHNYVEEELNINSDWLDLMYISYKGVSELFPILLNTIPAKSRVRELASQSLYVKVQPIISIEKLIKKRDVDKVLRDLILSQTKDIDLLSPYQTDKSAPAKMFFGRQQVLEHLHKLKENVFLYGPRRIGKSSTALQLQKLYGHLPVNKGFRARGEKLNRCSYVDLSTYGTNASKDIWKSIIKGFNLNEHYLYAALGRKLKPSVSRVGKHSQGFVLDEVTALNNFLTRFAAETVIILDEVDGWLEEEASKGWTTINQLRGLTDEGNAKVVLIGYENLLIALQNHKFPFWQRGSSVLLSPLKKEAIKELVLKPMEELNIRLVPEAQIIERIWQVTSGLPHLVQDICRHAVMLRGGDRMFELDHPKLNEAIGRSEALAKFQRGVLSCDLPLAEAITGIISFNTFRNYSDSKTDQTEPYGDHIVSNNDIIRYLLKSEYQYKSEEFDLALHYLELRSIIRPVDSNRTTWTWVNSIVCREMAKAISNTGFDNWRNDVVRRHQEGIWKKNYRLLGIIE